jgi:hypothetical protein
VRTRTSLRTLYRFLARNRSGRSEISLVVVLARMVLGQRSHNSTNVAMLHGSETRLEKAATAHACLAAANKIQDRLLPPVEGCRWCLYVKQNG